MTAQGGVLCMEASSYLFHFIFAVGRKQCRSNFTGLLCDNILPQQRYENTNSHFLLFKSIFPMTH